MSVSATDVLHLHACWPCIELLPCAVFTPPPLNALHRLLPQITQSITINRQPSWAVTGAFHQRWCVSAAARLHCWTLSFAGYTCGTPALISITIAPAVIAQVFLQTISTHSLDPRRSLHLPLSELLCSAETRLLSSQLRCPKHPAAAIRWTCLEAALLPQQQLRLHSHSGLMATLTWLAACSQRRHPAALGSPAARAAAMMIHLARCPRNSTHQQQLLV